ncbi:PREDICTED: SAM pointed domain-containing Ets transcription factor [Aptenodytes forsteri]|uniref:SAM pointed domain-containing Ets transcription factor n=1 Tax=Aptenodytes forsteri TaxID=9233 RepID=UPI00090596EF|nr:PREDICTED: SAM pointed domain-containing Ets transcription factor [Aptenodytes forsteri]
MGSASPGLTALPHSRLARPLPCLLSACIDMLPEQPLPAFCLHYFDMLYSEDVAWATKGMGEPSQSNAQGGRGEAQKEPEQCPIIDSQGLGLGAEGDLQASLHLEEHSLEQVQSMVVGEVLKDIETACKLLNIAADPADWSPGNVQKWILWTEHQYRLPQIGKSFQELSGKDLCAMSEEQFCQRSPTCGDILHAHLDIWKSAAWMKEKVSPGDVRYCGGDASWADSEVDSSCAGQPIHLWQFLKELLLKPHNYGRFIPCIFKIEDSAQVARLWGIRKNRPAMNYDKLSRSIRQYYKKGIIRKPDISQRLVYQFVHPV